MASRRRPVASEPGRATAAITDGRGDGVACAGAVDSYLRGLSRTLDEMSRPAIDAVVRVLVSAGYRGARIYIFGNGGSAATASHMANDLNKACCVPGCKRFRAITLNDNVPTMMAWANDRDYGDVLVEQLANHLEADDVVIAYSASGSSTNVIRGIEYARRVGAQTIGFTGSTGGKLGELVDWCVRVPSDVIGHQEDAHLALNHAITIAIRERLAAPE